MVLLLAISAVSGTPSAKMRLRALELVPQTLVASVACVSPLLRFRRKTLGRYFTASSASTRFTVSSARCCVMLTVTGSVSSWIGFTADLSSTLAVTFTRVSVTRVSRLGARAVLS